MTTSPIRSWWSTACRSTSTPMAPLQETVVMDRRQGGSRDRALGDWRLDLGAPITELIRATAASALDMLTRAAAGGIRGRCRPVADRRRPSLLFARRQNSATYAELADAASRRTVTKGNRVAAAGQGAYVGKGYCARGHSCRRHGAPRPTVSTQGNRASSMPRSVIRRGSAGSRRPRHCRSHRLMCVASSRAATMSP